MTITVSKRNSFQAAIDGRIIADNQGAANVAETTPFDVALSSDGLTALGPASVNNGAAATLWAAASSPVGDFDFFWIRSTQDIWLRLASATGSQTKRIKANDPYVLASNLASTSYAAGVLAGAPVQEVITSISVWNDSGAVAKISAYIAT